MKCRFGAVCHGVAHFASNLLPLNRLTWPASLCARAAGVLLPDLPGYCERRNDWPPRRPHLFEAHVTTADRDTGTLRRVLGTIVAMMLAGSALGMLGAFIFPARQARPPPWEDADRQTRGSVPERVRQNLTRNKPAPRGVAAKPVVDRITRRVGHVQPHKMERALAPPGEAHPLRPTRL